MAHKTREVRQTDESADIAPYVSDVRIHILLYLYDTDSPNVSFPAFICREQR